MSSKPIAELRKMAIDKCIPGCRAMNKEELIIALGLGRLENMEEGDFTEETEDKVGPPAPMVNVLKVHRKSNALPLASTTPARNDPVSVTKPTLRLSVKNLKADVRKALTLCENPMVLLHVFNLLTEDS